MTVTAPAPTSTSTSTSTSTITVEPVAGLIGAEVSGVDLGRELTPQQVADIRSALLRHRVLFFREQHIGPSEQVAFGARFGEVTPAHPTLPALPGHPEVLPLSTEEYAVDGHFTVENHWHTDVTFVRNPPLGSILRAVDVPAYGGDTGWTNLVAAYESLSAPLRALVDTLQAVHVNSYKPERGAQAPSAQGADFTSKPYSSVHPVVRVHPETGERALFVSGAFTSHILGLRNRESARLLDLLFEAIGDPRNTVRLRWQPGTIAFWDNRATAHLASFDYIGGRREHQRITLAGDAPVGPDGFVSQTLSGPDFT